MVLDMSTSEWDINKDLMINKLKRVGLSKIILIQII